MTKHNQSVIKVFQYRESKSENKSLKDVSVKSPGYGLEDLMSVSSGTVGPGEWFGEIVLSPMRRYLYWNSKRLLSLLFYKEIFGGKTDWFISPYRPVTY